MPYSSITKNALAHAIKDLMRETPFVKISVGDICDRCGLNRKTFYYHFRDKYDLVNWIFQTEFIEMMKVHSYSSGWKFIADLCGYLYSERAFYRSALQYEGQNSFRDFFSSTVGAILTIIMSEGSAQTEDQAFVVTFMTDALLISIIRWLTSAQEIPPMEFVRKLRKAMNSMADDKRV